MYTGVCLNSLKIIPHELSFKTWTFQKFSYVLKVLLNMRPWEYILDIQSLWYETQEIQQFN